MSKPPASHWDPQAYAANAAFVPAMGLPVVALLGPRAGERILDIGCGDGVLTAAIAAAGAEVIGVDSSPEMIAAARERGLDARVMGGEALDFDGEFDAAFSNAALHWMRDAAAVARGVARALKPGARFVGEMGGAGNVATIWSGIDAELAARGLSLPPSTLHWYPAVADFTAVYAAAGFTDISAELIDRPTPLPSGVKGWIATFMTGPFNAAGIDPATQSAIADAIDARLADRLRGPDGGWIADYVRLRFTMRKPA
ncbi:MAG: methyltransferase domain-containing protein [Candidatus Sphingomonas colombiensis]|nr:class I SAM-dependent methyltransferase [Sphingomonas sp.]WEK41867.1 MAG: methyltransferase domain-containing protein [Sphingomonas sp.]